SRHHGPHDRRYRRNGDRHPKRHDPAGHRPGLPATVPAPGRGAGHPGGDGLMEPLRAIFSAAFGYSLLRVSTPLIFASLAAVVSGRAGVINIGIEGMMLAAAFAGVAVSAFTASAWLGLLGAVITGIFMAMVLAYFSLKLKTDIILGGIALNLLASGGTDRKSTRLNSSHVKISYAV